MLLKSEIKATQVSHTYHAQASATDIAAAVKAGEASAEDYGQQALERLREVEHLNAVVHIDEALTMSVAKSVAQRLQAGENLLLAGVPFIIKDNLATADMPTSGGAIAYRGFQPTRNATTVQQMLNAGAVPVGKANLHELAFGITSSNAGFGSVINPFAPLRVAGGSSGGAAAVVAAGIPLGLGTDTGGSIRIPASFCGVYGLRTTLRRYSTQGVLTISPSRDVVGTMANSIDDLQLLDGVLARSLDVHPVPNISTLRVGVPRAPYFENLEPGISRRVENAMRVLADAGVTLIDVDAEELHRLDKSAGFCISAFEARIQWWRYCETQLNVRVNAFIESIASTDVRAIFEFFNGPEMFDAHHYSQALLDRQSMIRWYDEVFYGQGLDCLLLPTVSCEAPLLLESCHDMPVELSAALFAKVARQASPASLAGVPSLTLPIGYSDLTGVPVGLMCEGPSGGDQRLLAIGKRISTLLSMA
jgi:indoleacetamide hydrolase